MVQAVDERGARAEAVEIAAQSRSVADEVEAGRVTAEQASEAVELYGQMHGLSAAEARAETLAVLGNNRAEMVEGVRAAVSRVFGGSNILTVMHEHTHGRWRSLRESGRYSDAQGLAWARMAERASGVDFLPTKDDAAVSPEMLDEAIAEIVTADTAGRRKDGSRFSAGLIARGVASHALSQRAEAKAAGTLATFLKGWRAFWGQVLKAGRALQIWQKPLPLRQSVNLRRLKVTRRLKRTATGRRLTPW